MSRKATVIEIDPLMNGYQNEIENINNDVGSGKHIFLFLFMDGCGPCNQTKPQWKKIQKMLKNSHGNREDVVIATINQKLFENLKNAGKEPMGYPCLRYIKCPSVEEYEDSSIQNKDRTTESFINWIESKIQKQQGGKWSLKYKKSIDCNKPKGFSQRQHCKYGRKMHRGGKWSLKYKKSINCNRPKGFSQRQHCKYGRKTLKRKY
jgi:ribosomal protein L34